MKNYLPPPPDSNNLRLDILRDHCERLKYRVDRLEETTNKLRRENAHIKAMIKENWELLSTSGEVS